MKVSNLYIGTLSGPSADSIDAALFDFGKKIKLIGSLSKKIPQELKAKILKLSNSKKNLHANPTKELLELDESFAIETANLINKLLKKFNIDKNLIRAIGSHGQTIQHFPKIDNPYSLQIGNPVLISELTEIKTVANFRKANVENGGIGAPLTPAFHKDIFFSKKFNRVIVNIGGISNITRLIPGKKVIGWDSGPGNCLIDQCVQEFSNNKKQYDDKGKVAKKGNPHNLEKIIEKVLSSDYFKETLPKSQSILNFNFKKISKSNLKKSSFADWTFAMTEITALSIARDLIKFCNMQKVEIYICGGGSKNEFLIERLKNDLSDNFIIKKINSLGIDPMLIEACTFAWLGKKRIEKKKINLRNSTGAKPSLLGEIY